MARGVARMMGLRLMLNFCHPYLATSVGDFWSRWHISLSTWFRDYVYIPLGGNRCGTLVTYRNLFLTFVISGLWHGAAWTYVIWGALHGLGAIATRQAERSGWYEHVPRALRQAILFLFVCVTWVFFRANSLGDACVILERMVVGGWQDPACPLLALALILAIWLYQFLFESRLRGLIEFAPVKIGLVVAMLVYLSFFAGSAGQPFIYLQF
jgi:D-alanyl-lipoteichoic acid acyltransferase DltB (MBOAT superfamily)